MKMRKLKFLTVALLGASSMFLTSCETDDDPLEPQPNLKVTVVTSDNQVVENGDVTVPSGTTLSFRIEAVKTGGSDLNTFEISQGGTLTVTPLPTTAQGYQYGSGKVNLKNADDETYRDTMVIGGSFITSGEMVLDFTVTAKNGQSRTRTIKVTVDNPTPLSREVTGAFFHIGGSLHGAYNLVAEETVAKSGAAANKDMSNTDAAGNPFTGSWKAENGTSFVQDNSFNYATATEEGAMAAYNAGTSAKNVDLPQVGDIYIAKMDRGSSDYIVIQITKVDPTDNTCACGNTGIIEFDYKKKS